MKPLIVVVLLSVASLLPAGCRATQESSESGHAFATKRSSGEVSFELTPRRAEDEQLIVDIQANTHSGDLADVDLASVVSLQADGKTYRPTNATSLRGHHASATVTFTLESKPDHFSIALGPVRSLPVQSFEWP